MTAEDFVVWSFVGDIPIVELSKIRKVHGAVPSPKVRLVWEDSKGGPISSPGFWLTESFSQTKILKSLLSNYVVQESVLSAQGFDAECVLVGLVESIVSCAVQGNFNIRR